MANSMEVAVVGNKKALEVLAQAGVKRTRMVTEEYGAELRRAYGPNPTGEDRATERRLGRITSNNRGPTQF